MTYYPYYMRKKRKNLTAEQMAAADSIRQKLARLTLTAGYGVTFYTDGTGRDMARIGRTDGTGMGFMLTAQQAREWLYISNIDNICNIGNMNNNKSKMQTITAMLQESIDFRRGKQYVLIDGRPNVLQAIGTGSSSSSSSSPQQHAAGRGLNIR